METLREEIKRVIEAEEAWHAFVRSDFAASEARMDSIERQLNDNAALLREAITHNTNMNKPEEDAWRSYASEQFLAGEKRCRNLEAKLDVNNLATASLVETVESWNAAMKTIEYIGKCLRPLTWIIGFGVALGGAWASIKSDWKC